MDQKIGEKLYGLAMEMPDTRPLSAGKEDMRRIAEILLHRVGKDYDHSPHLLDQAVLAHLREDSQLAHLKGWVREELLKKIDKNLQKMVQKEELDALVDHECEAEGVLFEAMTRHADGELMVIGLTRWALSAYATVQMSHTYAAGLIATNLTLDVAEAIKPPFKAFIIELPNGLLAVDNEFGTSLPLRRVIVSKLWNNVIKREGWLFLATTDAPMTLWRYGVTAEQMLGVEDWHKDLTQNPTENPFAHTLTDKDARVTNCLGRLILNTCLAMADPENVKKAGPGHRAHAEARSKRIHGPPVVSTYILGRPLKHDVREAVRIYIEEGKEHKHLNVQTLVAGHWKWQAHGPQHSLRKLMFIEPYWRGPEDAPIVQRPHVLLGKKETST